MANMIEACKLKEKGNAAFSEEEYEQAIKYYSEAISLSKDKPNHIFYANRAAVYLEMNRNEDCISDCEKSILI